VIEDLKNSIEILLSSYIKDESVISHFQTLIDKVEQLRNDKYLLKKLVL